MLRVDLPAISAEDVFKTCATGIQNQDDLSKRLLAAKDDVVKKSNIYLFAAAQGKCGQLAASNFQVPGVAKDEMVWLYDRRFAAQRSKGRQYYNKLKAGARDGLCCLCGFREAGTLDHYLTKAKFLALAVNPYNLLPACWECNHGKGVAGEDTVHPYFDDFHLETWLHGEVVEVRPCVVDFQLVPPASWDAGLKARAAKHFEAFDLAGLYSGQAARRLSGSALTWTRTHSETGLAGVRRLLENERDSWADVDTNCWEAAFYRALWESDWFCDGGFAR